MKCKILLFSALIFSSFAGVAQQSRTFAITGDGNNDYLWMNIREVNLETGAITKTIFQRSQTNYSLTPVNGKKILGSEKNSITNIFTDPTFPTSTFVAAAAFDKKNNRLFFMPMRLSELRWVDLNEKSDVVNFHSIENPAHIVSPNSQEEEKHLTRMVIAADGKGYALSNDGQQLLQFTTGKKPVIKDLGALVDAESNNGISVKTKCTSWGGDMVADAFGKLYIISAAKNVFEVDVNTKIATHKGIISGLPDNFTANAAAVDDNGNLVVSSANVLGGYYNVNMKDLSATAISGSDTKYSVADLANGNLLFEKEAQAARNTGVAVLPAITVDEPNANVFPNPVSGNNFTVNFSKYQAGKYMVILTDLSGKSIQSTTVNLNKGLQNKTIQLNKKPANGLYLIKVINSDNKVMFTEKLVID